MFKKGLQDATSKDGRINRMSELELVATICMLMTMSDGSRTNVYTAT
ncbi:3098_t:CDS:2 [Rhizophagus irregularis]|nr:3098_t:CDS:2 [Rhizophagus irregularis]